MSTGLKGTLLISNIVTPYEAGVQLCQKLVDSCFRRNDIFRGSLNDHILPDEIDRNCTRKALEAYFQLAM